MSDKYPSVDYASAKIYFNRKALGLCIRCGVKVAKGLFCESHRNLNIKSKCGYCVKDRKWFTQPGPCPVCNGPLRELKYSLAAAIKRWHLEEKDMG